MIVSNFCYTISSMNPESSDNAVPENILKKVSEVEAILESLFVKDGVCRPWNFGKLDAAGFNVSYISSNNWLFRIGSGSCLQNFVELLPEKYREAYEHSRFNKKTPEQVIDEVVAVIREEISERPKKISLKWLKSKIPGISSMINRRFVDPDGVLLGFEYFVTFLPEDIRNLVELPGERYEKNIATRESVIEQIVENLEKIDPENTNLNLSWIFKKCRVSSTVINKLFKPDRNNGLSSTEVLVNSLPEKWRKYFVKGQIEPVYLKIKRSLPNTYENSGAVLNEYLSSLEREDILSFHYDYGSYSRDQKNEFFTKINNILNRLLVMRKEGIVEAEYKIIELTVPIVKTFIMNNKIEIDDNGIIKEIETDMFLWMGGPDAMPKKMSFVRYLLRNILFNWKKRNVPMVYLDSLAHDDGSDTLHDLISRRSIAPGAAGYSEEIDMTIPDDEFVDRPFDEWE